MAELSSNIYGYITKLYGEEQAKNYLSFIDQDPALYLRVNNLKTTPQKLINDLSNYYGIKAELFPLLPNVIKVVDGNNLTGKTLEHILGHFYMQGLSSMMPPLVVNPTSEDYVLDLCSAPGSKTTQMAEMMGNKGTLAANEISSDRVKMLSYNVDRMSLVNTGIIHNRGEWLSKIFDSSFDKILVDAPCSGLGIIQKKEEVNKWWNEDTVKGLSEMQLRLLVGAIKMAKPGGTIVYSTCTLTVEENEFVVNKVLEKYPVQLVDVTLPVKSIDGFTGFEGLKFDPSLAKTRRIIPWEADSDGFFVAKFQKIDYTNAMEPTEERFKDIKILSFESKQIKKQIQDLAALFGIPLDVFAEYKYLLKGNDLNFVNRDRQNDKLGFFEKAGTRFGVIDKNDDITLHTQAAQVLEKYFTKNIYDLKDKEEAKRYLEGGIVKTPYERAQCVVSYLGNLLGTAIGSEHGIKSRFPRAKRTQGIIIPGN